MANSIYSNPIRLDSSVCGVISSSTNANPSVVTTAADHNLKIGMTVEIVGHTTNTAINGVWPVTAVPSATTFTIPVAANGIGADGSWTRILFNYGTAHINIASIHVKNPGANTVITIDDGPEVLVSGTGISKDVDDRNSVIVTPTLTAPTKRKFNGPFNGHSFTDGTTVAEIVGHSGPALYFESASLYSTGATAWSIANKEVWSSGVVQAANGPLVSFSLDAGTPIHGLKVSGTDLSTNGPDSDTVVFIYLAEGSEYMSSSTPSGAEWRSF